MNFIQNKNLNLNLIALTHTIIIKIIKIKNVIYEISLITLWNRFIRRKDLIFLTHIFKSAIKFENSLK